MKKVTLCLYFVFRSPTNRASILAVLANTITQRSKCYECKNCTVLVFVQLSVFMQIALAISYLVYLYNIFLSVITSLNIAYLEIFSS